jgi:hypothetical protein
MKFWAMMAVLVLSHAVIIGTATAEDTPEDLVKTVAEATQTVPVAETTPVQRWRKFLQGKGWDAGLAEGGVLFIADRGIIISSGSAYTMVQPGQPGWIESRIAAFENAEMDAKGKIIRYLVETIETKRSLTILENAVFADGDVKQVQRLNEVADIMERIGEKSLALTEASLDSALRKLDQDYDPAKYEGKTAGELQTIAENLFKRQVKAVAMGTLIGASSLYSTEGFDENQYQVLVGVIWTPKLNRLAMSLFNDVYNIPAVTPGKSLTKQIPADELTLLGTVGTRIVIDENGQYAVMAYGQAQPRRAAPGRKQSALHQAKQIAANRARGQLVNYIREGIALRDTEISQELSREFSDLTVGTEIMREYRKSIQGKNVKVTLSGLRILKEWSMKHPVTGQMVAGAVMAWSPAAAMQSKQAAEVMRNKPMATDKSVPVSAPLEDKVIESMPVDTSAY